ncbi:DMSO reductase anchor subunit [Cedecea neteri]|uniref:DMSO reductase anchor subunit n=1 Tax=Cedecea neteri TaxID=158822 RepID=A0A2X2V3C3_9ENTR|nr:DMSO reductase anchor subunit [Cedecea neteri]
MPQALSKVWAVVTMILGVVFVWMMSRVYLIDTVPTWFSLWTPMNFFLTMFIGGPLLGYLLLRAAGVNGWGMRILPVITLLALVVSMIVVLMQGMELATLHSSIQQASALVPEYGSLMAWRMVFAGPRSGLLDCTAAERISSGRWSVDAGDGIGDCG